MALEVQLKQQHQQQTHAPGGVGVSRSHTTPITSSFLSAFDSKPSPITLDLFHSEIFSSPVELDEPSPLPSGWQKCLSLKTGEVYYTKDNRSNTKNTRTTPMSRNGKNTRLDLKLNLSPPRGNRQQVESPNRSGNSSPTSPPSSCVSTELNNDETVRYSTSPEATSMVLVGCPRCLMYVMLSETDPKCPKCKSTVLLDFVHDNNTKRTKKNWSPKGSRVRVPSQVLILGSTRVRSFVVSSLSLSICLS